MSGAFSFSQTSCRVVTQRKRGDEKTRGLVMWRPLGAAQTQRTKGDILYTQLNNTQLMHYSLLETQEACKHFIKAKQWDWNITQRWCIRLIEIPDWNYQLFFPPVRLKKHVYDNVITKIRLQFKPMDRVWFSSVFIIISDLNELLLLNKRYSFLCKQSWLFLLFPAVFPLFPFFWQFPKTSVSSLSLTRKSTLSSRKQVGNDSIFVNVLKRVNTKWWI